MTIVGRMIGFLGGEMVIPFKNIFYLPDFTIN